MNVEPLFQAVMGRRSDSRLAGCAQVNRGSIGLLMVNGK
jgi:hypothetical protein